MRCQVLHTQYAEKCLLAAPIGARYTAYLYCPVSLELGVFFSLFIKFLSFGIVENMSSYVCYNTTSKNIILFEI